MCKQIMSFCFLDIMIADLYFIGAQNETKFISTNTEIGALKWVAVITEA